MASPLSIEDAYGPPAASGTVSLADAYGDAKPGDKLSLEAAYGGPSIASDVGAGLAAGFRSGVADLARQADFAARGIERGLEAVGVPPSIAQRGGAFQNLAEAATPTEAPQTLPGKIAAGVASAPAALAEYLPAAAASTALTGTPVPGMVAVGALQGAANAPPGERVSKALTGGAVSGALGGLGELASTWPAAVRATMQAGAGGTIAAAQGGDARDIAANAAVFGALGALGKARKLPGEEAPAAPPTAAETAPPSAGAESRPVAVLRLPDRTPTRGAPMPEAAPATPPPTPPAETAAAAEVPPAPKEKLLPVLQSMERPGPPSPKAGNLSIPYWDTSDGLRKAITATAEAYDGFEPARRGVVSWDDTQALANRMGMTVGDLTARRQGQAFNAHEAKAALDLLTETGGTLEKAAATVREQPTPVNLAAFSEALARHAAVQEQVSGVTAEAGRALNIFRKSRTTLDRAGAVQEILRRSGGSDRLEAIAEGLAALPTEKQRAAFARQALPATTPQKLLEAWKAGLLSGPQTHARNTLSNTLFNLSDIGEQAIAAGIGKLHGGEKVLAREVPARIAATMEGARDGLRMAWAAFQSEGQAQGLKGEGGVPGGAIGGRLGRWIRVPFRALTAADQFWKTVAERQEVNSLAIREAARKGLSGQSFADEVARLRSDPTPAMQEAASSKATYLTFQSPLGESGRKLQSFIRSHPTLEVIVPFFRTPTNIFKRTVERTPAGVLMPSVREALRDGGVPRDLAIARMISGSAVAGLVVYEALQGHITGGGPPNRGEREVLQQSGWQPYSIKVGDKFYSYSGLEPISSLLGIAADYAEVGQHASELTRNELAGQIALAYSRNLLSKTFLKGISGAISAMMDPEHSAGMWASALAESTVPAGVAQAARTMDPTLRETQDTIDSIKSRVPGLRETLPPRIDLFGGAKHYEGSLGPDFASPIYTREASRDPVAQEMVRLGLGVGPVSRKVKGQALDAATYQALATQSGQLAHQLLLPVVTSPGWQQIPDEEKKRIVKSIFEKSRSGGRALTVPPQILAGQHATAGAR